jgi:hypothetical protein
MKRFDAYGSAAQILRASSARSGRLPTLNVDMIFNLPSLTDDLLGATCARSSRSAPIRSPTTR